MSQPGESGLHADHQLLESQIEAINRFPDENPNPVLRVANDGRLIYANAASLPIRLELRVNVGDALPRELFERLMSAVSTNAQVEVTHENRTFALLPVPVPELAFTNVYGTDVTAERAVARFPNQNPNPVFRVDESGTLIYANQACQPLITAFGLEVGDRWPDAVASKVLAVVDSPDGDLVELEADFKTYALCPVRVAEFGFINVYGTDITAQKVVAKFPAQNPNPVLRTSREGVLIYANDASRHLVDGLGLARGQSLPLTLWDEVSGRLEGVATGPLEVSADSRIYELLPVLVPEFDFINLYGTDVTAARDVARAKEETERLLLNILPPPIADRLRAGEKVIADRFEDATLLIADIVGFTELSSELSADELVELLDSVFGRLDVLVQLHGIEKVKTIGDAYMVIGGVPVPTSDHVERVADFALDMSDTIESIQREMLRPMSCRIGINCGPVVAGVIGTKRTIYDVWGDTVNVASRMESLGQPGRIQVTPAVYERLRGRYQFEDRGEIDVKGKGRMSTYFLTGRR